MIFADSSFFIAIADKKDQWHKRAKKLLEDIKVSLMITDLVLAESITAVGARGGGKAGMALYDYLVDNCQIIFTSREALEKAMKVFLKYDGTLSVADSITVVVIESQGVNTLLSFDSDFDKVKGLKRLA